MYKLDTSLDIKILSLPIFISSLKLMKSVVSLIDDFIFVCVR